MFSNPGPHRPSPLCWPCQPGDPLQGSSPGTWPPCRRDSTRVTVTSSVGPVPPAALVPPPSASARPAGHRPPRRPDRRAVLHSRSNASSRAAARLSGGAPFSQPTGKRALGAAILSLKIRFLSGLAPQTPPASEPLAALSVRFLPGPL